MLSCTDCILSVLKWLVLNFHTVLPQEVEHIAGILQLGENDIEFLHTPGHTPGSQCYKVNNNLVSGDTLFVQGCGRVDLPGSNSEDMFHSLQKLSSLPDETILYPGHNYSAEPYESMERVKEINTYLRIEDLDMWKQIM